MPGAQQPAQNRGTPPYGMDAPSGPTHHPAHPGQPGQTGYPPHGTPGHGTPPEVSAGHGHPASEPDDSTTINHRRDVFPGSGAPGRDGGHGTQNMPRQQQGAAAFGQQGNGSGGPDFDPPGLGTEIFELSGIGDKPKGPGPARVESRTGMFLLVGIALAGLAVIVILVASALSGSGDSKTTGSSAPINKSQVDADRSSDSSGSSDSSELSGKAATPSPSASGVAAKATSPAEDAGTGADASDRPTASGLRKHIEPDFAIDVPMGLDGVSHKGKVTFSARDGSRRLTVQPLTTRSADLRDAVNAAERKVYVEGRYPFYKLLRLDAVVPPPYPGTDVVDWEFTYSANGQTVHVLSRWVHVPNGRSHVIRWSAPHASWADGSPERTMVLDSFTPTRDDSPGGS